MVMTPFDLEVVFRFRSSRINIRADIRPFKENNPFDIKYVIWRPFCF